MEKTSQDFFSNKIHLQYLLNIRNTKSIKCAMIYLEIIFLIIQFYQVVKVKQEKWNLL